MCLTTALAVYVTYLLLNTEYVAQFVSRSRLGGSTRKDSLSQAKSDRQTARNQDLTSCTDMSRPVGATSCRCQWCGTLRAGVRSKCRLSWCTICATADLGGSQDHGFSSRVLCEDVVLVGRSGCCPGILWWESLVTQVVLLRCTAHTPYCKISRYSVSTVSHRSRHWSSVLRMHSPAPDR